MAVDAASSFSFCRPAVEYRALPEDFKHQLSRRTGGNLTWHDGRGQKAAGGRGVKLLQQPGTEARQPSWITHPTPNLTILSFQ
ncbi:sterile alpha motif domain-containing protein 10-like [Dunckerocampus dactyliophorus]|uniref:sterile alpha motif domain-containing protein 10-like n=1 Tax=Dunckerocampus dactyliophorus TaxID=161453 RepID=UPI002405D7DA|nr:sterile alpha motif domain-containing protein 10-like [Dunckerocampus dactyliophorus]